jgi:hypothetical protein
MKRFCYLLHVTVVFFLIAGCGKSKTVTEPKPDVVQSMDIKHPGDSEKALPAE